MELRNLSSLITEVQGTVFQTRYPQHGKGKLEHRYWLVLGKFIQKTGTPCVAVIDLKQLVYGVKGDPRAKSKKKSQSKPRYGMEGIRRLKQRLPEILGFIDDKTIQEKPKANIETIKQILAKYGEEGVKELGEVLRYGPEEEEKVWKHQAILPSKVTQDILHYFEQIGMTPRPLKGTTATDGRYKMGLVGIKDPIINGIFKYYYKTPAIGKMSGSPVVSVLTHAPKLSDQQQSEELLKIAKVQTENIIKEFEQAKAPEKPEPEELVPIEPGEDLPVATAKEPLTPPPEVEPDVAPKEVPAEGEPEIPKPVPGAPPAEPTTAILKSPELQRKAIKPQREAPAPETIVSLEPEKTAPEPSAEPPVKKDSPQQQNIAALAKANMKTGNLKPTKPPILKAPQAPPPLPPRPGGKSPYLKGPTPKQREEESEE